MTSALQNRLVGTAIVVAIAVIFLPDLLDGKQETKRNLFVNLPEKPTMKDWEDHLTTAFPEVRLKQFLEMRGTDAGPWRRICALPALWVGLLYDDKQLNQAADWIADWTIEDHAYLRSQVPKYGLCTPFKGATVRDLALRMLAMSRAGLEKRAIKTSCGKDESVHLTTIQEIADTGVTPAERKLGKYHGVWNQQLDEIFKLCSY